MNMGLSLKFSCRTIFSSKTGPPLDKMQESEQSEEYALFSTVLMVGSTTGKHNAVLLPTAHKHFLYLIKKKTPMPMERSCRWLLRQLEKVI